ncbi:hypothetical protein FisN_8Hu043 [Fistulifera solaris]|uniref:Uncharacterized protein n=1 Tax=Fistulifera solaris TaxID=1519565 RepID=A0A1Z5JK17_FISSO|nr:hypothetical protein FisN_8Hu043 [Fistulifera solaris]|eukprot:GAX14121.1 hypothetical protein FisN_8Hu043 [Fistulifera solaris]
MSEKDDSSSVALFEVIPPFLCRPEQVARWQRAGESPTYKLLRKPNSLEELNSYKYCMAIWSENGTLTYLTPHGRDDYPRENALTLKYRGGGPTLHICGSSNLAINQTADYFMCLEKPTDESNCLRIESTRAFDFSGAGTRCLEHMFQVAPSRPVEFFNIDLSTQQSTILATRPHPVRLVFNDCELEDSGTAFLDALESYSSSLALLKFEESLPLDYRNLQRLLALNGVIDELSLPLLLDDEFALLPFSANVRRLEYELLASSLSQADLESLHIPARQLFIRIEDFDRDAFPTDIMLSFFRRLAHMGHFIELKVRFLFVDNDFAIPDSVIQELICTAHANDKLQVLDLCTQGEDLEWDPHVKTLCRGLQNHKALRNLILEVRDDAFGRNFCHLRKLLSKNRQIVVMDELKRFYTDGSSIDELYSLNKFYRGSADLEVTPLSKRSPLVATTLVRRASNSFRRTALLLSNHTDALFDLVQIAGLNGLSGKTSSRETTEETTSTRKRRRL